MSDPHETIEHRIQKWGGHDLDAHYLAYFDCFNHQLYFEAHEVLERLWLGRRRDPEGDFYKGLIQLTGAFVHLQRDRRPPAISLFKLARAHLVEYPSGYQRLDTTAVLRLIEDWLRKTEGTPLGGNPLRTDPAPSLELSRALE